MSFSPPKKTTSYQKTNKLQQHRLGDDYFFSNFSYSFSCWAEIYTGKVRKTIFSSTENEQMGLQSKEFSSHAHTTTH